MALVEVTFRWDDKHGPCYDCGNPAAFYVAEVPDIKLCAVCGCNRAVDGDTIRRLNRE